MKFLPLFSLNNLALISDWLNETGELYVDVYMPHSGGGSIGYFIRSLEDLKSLVAKQDWREIVFTVFHHTQFALRGTADEHLLAKALEVIPENSPYEIVNLWYYPEYCNHCGSGNSHAELRHELTGVFGELVGIGRDPDVYSKEFDSNINDVFVVSLILKNNFQVYKNQDFYESYTKHPERYKWVEELWHA